MKTSTQSLLRYSQKMASEGLSYEDLANENLNAVLAPILEEIKRLEDNIETMEATGDAHRTYPFVKRRREIIEAKTARLRKLKSDYQVSPDLHGCAVSLDNLSDHNKGVELMLQASEEIIPLHNKLSKATEYIQHADGNVSPGLMNSLGNLGNVLSALVTNTKTFEYKNKTDLENRFFKALKRDDEIFNQKVCMLNSVNEYATILEEPTEAISRQDMARYENEWDHVQAILALQTNNRK